MLRSKAVRRASRARKSSPSPLTGKLFDESGQSLTPSHAVKGERRYRYYVIAQPDQRTDGFDGTRMALTSARDRTDRCIGGLHDTWR